MRSQPLEADWRKDWAMEGWPKDRLLCRLVCPQYNVASIVSGVEKKGWGGSVQTPAHGCKEECMSAVTAQIMITEAQINSRYWKRPKKEMWLSKLLSNGEQWPILGIGEWGKCPPPPSYSTAIVATTAISVCILFALHGPIKTNILKQMHGHTHTWTARGL